MVIEIPKGSFLKVGSSGELDFVSPLPCPFNYGSMPGLLGLEGDLLDAVVLGPRLPRGTRVEVPVFGAVGLYDRDLYDDKLICAHRPPSPAQRRFVAGFLRFYGWSKRLLNLLRGRAGVTRSGGWVEVSGALARAREVPKPHRPRPRIGF